MELRDRIISNGVALRVLLACAALLLPGSLKLQSESHLIPKQGPQPLSSATAYLFPCIQSGAQTNPKNRVALLHGPDWVLESSVRPSCFPEREVVFVTEVGRGIMAHPHTVRIRLWVTKEHDVTHIRIVDSSAGSREQEMVAVGFVTNHKCIDSRSKNCSVKGGAAFVPMDY
jgi:hypothetical protein